MSYSPSVVTVDRGVIVIWLNDDNVAHTVTAGDKSFDSGDIMPGGSFKHVFDIGGTYNYYCAHHSETGTVNVLATQ
jgi:manganese oxidase